MRDLAGVGPACRGMRGAALRGFTGGGRLGTLFGVMLGDIEAYYRSLAPRLTAYLVAGGTPHAVACEIVQESFLRLWKRREEIDDEPGRVSGLLHTIARNLRNDRYRHERFTVYAPDVGTDEAVADPRPDGGDRAYLRGRLMAALKDLPPLLRETYLLFHVSELSVREIARQTGVTESLVKVRIFRAKEKLQAALADLRGW